LSHHTEAIGTAPRRLPVSCTERGSITTRYFGPHHKQVLEIRQSQLLAGRICVQQIAYQPSLGLLHLDQLLNDRQGLSQPRLIMQAAFSAELPA
jgi:hypothetical protein